MTEGQMQHISNSEIQCFKRCRRKWWLAYHRKLRKIEQKVTGPLQLGTRVHESLAVMYDPMPGDPIQSIKDQYELAKDLVDPEDPDTRDALNKESDLALRMIEGYIEWIADTGLDDDIEVLATEKELTARFDDSMPVTIIGKLDTRIRRKSDGALLSMDHKTCASFDGVTKTLEINEQPLMYQLLERLTQPENQWVTGGIYNMLRKVKRTAQAKPPFYMREPIYHNDIELRTFWTRLYGVLTVMMIAKEELDSGISSDLVAYPSPHSNCSWDCEFRQVCPMFNDGSNVELAIENLYEVHNPNERYKSEEASL